MKKLAEEIIAGFEDAIAHAKGDKSRGTETIFTVSRIDVKSIRQKTGLTQNAFSQLFAINIKTLQDWEQYRRNPSSAARLVLTLIDKHPSTVKATIKSLGYPPSEYSSSRPIASKAAKPKNQKSQSLKKAPSPKPAENRLRSYAKHSKKS